MPPNLSLVVPAPGKWSREFSHDPCSIANDFFLPHPPPTIHNPQSTIHNPSSSIALLHNSQSIHLWFSPSAKATTVIQSHLRFILTPREWPKVYVRPTLRSTRVTLTSYHLLDLDYLDYNNDCSSFPNITVGVHSRWSSHLISPTCLSPQVLSLVLTCIASISGLSKSERGRFPRAALGWGPRIVGHDFLYPTPTSIVQRFLSNPSRKVKTDAGMLCIPPRPPCTLLWRHATIHLQYPGNVRILFLPFSTQLPEINIYRGHPIERIDIHSMASGIS